MTCDDPAPKHLSTHSEGHLYSQIGLCDESEQGQGVIAARIPGEAPIGSSAKASDRRMSLKKPDHASYANQDNGQKGDYEYDINEIQDGAEAPGCYKAR